MTTIAVKDGVLAVDSACSDSGVTIGAVTKYAEVPDFHGGGVAAACGSSAATNRALRDLCQTGEFDSSILKDNGEVVWLRSDGTTVFLTEDGPLHLEAPFFASGSGRFLAMGAMAAGASAEQALQIACDMDQGTSGPVHSFKVTG